MFPAMDRSTPTPPRRSWIVLGLGIFLGLSSPGCSELKSQIFGDQKIGEIGHYQDPTDLYARNNPPRSLMPVPTTNQPLSTPTGTVLNEVEEAGPTILPAETSPAEVRTTGGVALQRPRPIESNPGVKLASATAGVPNAAKILASTERRPEVTADAVVAQARAALDSMTSYEIALHRQERVNGSLLPEEDAILAIRRSPKAVRLSWPTGANQGREVLYRADEPGGQMHVKMANPVMPRLTLDPENPMVMKNSRHPVTEAGFDSLVEGLENGVQSSALTYAGIETPQGLEKPAHCVTRTTPTGEHWRVYLDVENHLPSLVQAVDAKGELLERYVFHDLKANPAELASADAFDPIARWGQPKGLLSRFAKAGGESQDNAANGTTTPR
jgi:hypothetical protein